MGVFVACWGEVFLNSGHASKLPRSVVAVIFMHETRLHGVFKCACACKFVKDFTSKLCLLQVVSCALLFPRSMFCGRGKSRYCHTKADYFHGSGSCASCVGAQDFRDPSWGGVESLERRGISLLRRMRALDDSGGYCQCLCAVGSPPISRLLCACHNGPLGQAMGLGQALPKSASCNAPCAFHRAV